MENIKSKFIQVFKCELCEKIIEMDGPTDIDDREELAKMIFRTIPSASDNSIIYNVEKVMLHQCDNFPDCNNLGIARLIGYKYCKEIKGDNNNERKIK